MFSFIQNYIMPIIIIIVNFGLAVYFYNKKNYRFYTIVYTFFGIFLILNTTIVAVCHIPSESMEPTLNVGDYIFTTRYDADQLERYDISVFIPPDEKDTWYVKRVIGLPGETITFKNHHVYADGKLLREDFIAEEMFRNDEGSVYIVPEDSYFMLGDNRNYSNDSRFWFTSSFVKKDRLQAKAKAIIFPFHHIKKL